MASIEKLPFCHKFTFLKNFFKFHILFRNILPLESFSDNLKNFQKKNWSNFRKGTEWQKNSFLLKPFKSGDANLI